MRRIPKYLGILLLFSFSNCNDSGGAKVDAPITIEKEIQSAHQKYLEEISKLPKRNTDNFFDGMGKSFKEDFVISVF